MDEQWKSAFGFEGVYEASTLGRIRRIKGSMGTKCGVLRPQYNTHGYQCLRLCVDGKPRTVSVHKLIVETFIDKVPKGWCVNHLDGNPANNRVDNLEITTYSGNAIHAVRYLGWRGTSHPGMKNPIAKLTDDQVHYIRQAPRKHGIATQIAKELGVSLALVCAIRSRKAWKHLD